MSAHLFLQSFVYQSIREVADETGLKVYDATDTYSLGAWSSEQQVVQVSMKREVKLEPGQPGVEGWTQYKCFNLTFNEWLQLVIDLACKGQIENDTEAPIERPRCPKHRHFLVEGYPEFPSTAEMRLVCSLIGTPCNYSEPMPTVRTVS